MSRAKPASGESVPGVAGATANVVNRPIAKAAAISATAMSASAHHGGAFFF